MTLLQKLSCSLVFNDRRGAVIFSFLTSFRYKPHEHELHGFPREGEEPSSLGSSHI